MRIYNTALTDAQVEQLYTLVPAGVTLNSNDAASLGAAGSSQLSVGAGTTFNVGVSQQVETLSGAGSVTLNSNTLTVGTGPSDTSSSTFSGIISGATGQLILKKASGGSLTLTGANIYGGGTIINGGTLVAVSAPGTGSITLNAGTLRVGTPPVTGFGGNGVGFGASGTAGGWTVNTNNFNSGAFPSTNVLQLTDGGGGENRSAFYNTPVAYAGGFTASFTYTPSYTAGGDNPADGAAFILQNDPRGAAALGAGGSRFRLRRHFAQFRRGNQYLRRCHGRRGHPNHFGHERRNPWQHVRRAGESHQRRPDQCDVGLQPHGPDSG